jgi:2-polyprenyl-3-methyl-5-hydroxy-6-metoxy-1,4-benzoquinol methylase
VEGSWGEGVSLYSHLHEISRRPAPFERYTAPELWTDEHVSSRMLAHHLDGSSDVSSRKTEFIEESVAWIVRRFGLSEGVSVADFGCGPGLYTIRLAASGADVTGVDFSERSLRCAREHARTRGMSIDYVCVNYLDYESDRRFDLITLIMCDFCALSPDQRRVLLDKFRAHLKPGGALLFDVYSLCAFDAREEQARYAPNLLDGFWSSAPYFGFLNTFKYEAEKVVLDKYTILEERRVRTIYNWLQYFSVEMLRGEIESRGLLVDDILDDVAGAPMDPGAHEFAVVARRPADP